MAWQVCFTNPATGQRICLDMRTWYPERYWSLGRPLSLLAIPSQDLESTPNPWRADVAVLASIDEVLDSLHDRELATSLRTGVQDAARGLVARAGEEYEAELTTMTIPF